jgi:hypothetical protein
LTRSAQKQVKTQQTLVRERLSSSCYGDRASGGCNFCNRYGHLQVGMSSGASCDLGPLLASLKAVSKSHLWTAVGKSFGTTVEVRKSGDSLYVLQQGVANASESRPSHGETRQLASPTVRSGNSLNSLNSSAANVRTLSLVFGQQYRGVVQPVTSMKVVIR